MPHLPIDYNRGVIYKIVCNDTNVEDCYVGSTTHFINRKQSHASRVRNTNKRTTKSFVVRIYNYIRLNGGWDNFSMVLVEKYPCNSKIELHQRERYWMETLKSSLNMSIPCRSKTEYLALHKVEKSTYDKQRRHDHGDRINEQKRNAYALRKNNRYICECGKTGTIHNKYIHVKSNQHLERLANIVKMNDIITNYCGLCI